MAFLRHSSNMQINKRSKGSIDLNIHNTKVPISELKDLLFQFQENFKELNQSE